MLSRKAAISAVPKSKAHERERLCEPWRIYCAQQRRARADVHRGERLAIAVQGHHHIEDPRRTEDLLIKLNRIGVEQLTVVGADRQRLVFVVGIGADAGCATGCRRC